MPGVDVSRGQVFNGIKMSWGRTVASMISVPTEPGRHPLPEEVGISWKAVSGHTEKLVGSSNRIYKYLQCNKITEYGQSYIRETVLFFVSPFLIATICKRLPKYRLKLWKGHCNSPLKQDRKKEIEELQRQHLGWTLFPSIHLPTQFLSLSHPPQPSLGNRYSPQ